LNQKVIYGILETICNEHKLPCGLKIKNAPPARSQGERESITFILLFEGAQIKD